MAKGNYLFAVLCENIIKEASTTIDAIKKVPGGRELGQYLHKNHSMPHDFNFRKSEISLGRGGDNRWQGGRWYVIAGEKGAAALRYSNQNRTYELVAPRPKNDEKFKDTPGDANFIDYSDSSGKGTLGVMKSIIGKPVEVYMGDAEQTRSVAKKQEKRRELKNIQAKQELTSFDPVPYLLNKFKPTFLRVLKNADAELRGMIQMQIKNNAYQAAEKKLNKLKMLDKHIQNLELGGTDKDNEIFAPALTKALKLAAQHYYPELSGGLIPGGYDYGRNSFRLANDDGFHKLIDDIKNGDTKKLSGVLQYFKNMVLHQK
jgi:hypothetical protein